MSGNPLALKVGPITLVEIVAVAERTLSGSTNTFASFGTIEANIEMMSSGPSLAPFREFPESDLGIPLPDVVESVNATGLVVKRAARRRIKVSCNDVSKQAGYK
jgi:hypothetical protein